MVVDVIRLSRLQIGHEAGFRLCRSGEARILNDAPMRSAMFRRDSAVGLVFGPSAVPRSGPGRAASMTPERCCELLVGQKSVMLIFWPEAGSN
jgi:hypothetical protein